MRPLRRRFTWWAAGSLWAALAFAPGAADPSLTVDDLRVAQTPAGARVTLDLNRNAEPAAFVLPGGEARFVVDLPAAAWAGGQQAGEGPIRNIRHARRGQDLRVVVDLTGPARLARTERIEHARGLRLVYDLAVAPAAAPRPTEARPAELELAKPTPMMRPAPKPVGRKTIVIDAGHGGKDPGALSAKGGREKDFNLAAAKALKATLEQRGFVVALTRETDIFLPLQERVRIARQARADLFISLHSDADANKRARGATVYTLSQNGGARAKAMADAQDWGVEIGESAPAKVTDILLDLTQRETLDHSRDFAKLLIEEFGEAAPLATKAVRKAGFFVLLAPDVPAVLLEMGYVTHPEDERRLADPAARAKAMEKVADAVSGYFAKDAAYASVSMLQPSFAGAASP